MIHIIVDADLLDWTFQNNYCDFDRPERKGHGAKGPESDLAREWICQGPVGHFAPGSELTREQKGYG